jgi:plasmid stabilization system protein ParE
MTFVVRLRAEAENDIQDAAVWYESQRVRLGHDFLDAIEASFTRISENPLQFPVLYRGTRRALLSRFPFGVFFRAEGQTIVVLAVMHASRNPIRWRERT